ncbi:MAG: IS3 family transposase [Thermoanaerobaculia bacterium]
MCESFFATLEYELLDRTRFADRTGAELAVFDFIEGFCNTRRRHSGIGNLAPVVFEQRQLASSETEAFEGSHPLLGPPPQGGGGKDLSASL